MTDALLWLAVAICVTTLLWLLAWTAGHLPHVHLWRRVHLSENHIHAYYECRCGKRMVRRGIGCQPLALGWLDGGTYPECERMKPPPKTVPPQGAKL